VIAVQFVVAKSAGELVVLQINSSGDKDRRQTAPWLLAGLLAG